MSYIDTFKRLLRESGIDYTTDSKKRGLVLNTDDNEVEITMKNIYLLFPPEIYGLVDISNATYIGDS